MVVKKKGGKWYPVGKKGKLWKNGFASEKAAKKAIANLKKAFPKKKKGTASKSTSKKKPKSKSKSKSKSKNKSKSNNKGGKKMKSRLSPVNKNGLKLVTTLLLLAGAAVVFIPPEGRSTSVYQHLKKGEYDHAGNMLRDQWRRPSIAKDLTKAGVAIGVVAKVSDVRSFSFVQFS